MADFTQVMTSISNLDDSILQEFSEGTFLAYKDNDIVEQSASFVENGVTGSYKFRIPNGLSVDTTALTDKEDPLSTVLTDTSVTLTPVEYGAVVTTTKLANFQTGGLADRAATYLLGVHAGQKKDKLAFAALDATTNIITPSDIAVGSLTTDNVLDATMIEKAYNKLRKANIPTMPGGYYHCYLHPDVASVFRSQVEGIGWYDAAKYTNAMPIMKNEIGMFKGFRFIEHSLAPISDGGGDGSTDVYSTFFLGYGALGKASSADIQTTLTSTDKLNRFLNVGWYGVFTFGIVDTNAIWNVKTASPFGNNA